jgi:hypothetical protein
MGRLEVMDKIEVGKKNDLLMAYRGRLWRKGWSRLE